MNRAMHSSDEHDVKQTVMNLIENGSIYNVEKLDEHYLDNMQIIRVTQEGRTSLLGKKEVLHFFQSLRASGAEPLDTAAEFNRIEAHSGMAHVVLTRIMRLFGNTEKSVYSLCLVK